MSKFRFLEVGPRDGLQNESQIFSLEDKVEFIKKLALAGLDRIELGSFVSPQAIPQMANTSAVVNQVHKLQKENVISKDVKFSALVPNEKGFQEALKCQMKEIAIFAGCTDSFSKKNINCSVSESFKIYEDVCKEALLKNLKVRGYLSVAFFCPYEGLVSEEKVLSLTQKMKEMGVYEISISDTIGTAHPLQVKSLLKFIQKEISLNKVALHFHNINGMALCNILTAYQEGVCSFDGSVGGLGGCPYAKVQSGNVPSEEVLYLLGGKEDPRVKNLVQVVQWLESKLKRSLPSRIASSPYYKNV